jgi:hypothetical protein
MEKLFNIPKVIAVCYHSEPQTGFYNKSAQQPEPIACNSMPYELKREYTRATQIKCNADEVLTLRERKENGSRKLLTGIQPIFSEGWYIGNHVRKYRGDKVVSDILFYFYPQNDRMIAFFFSGYHVISKELRECFAQSVIPHLKTKYSI